MRIATIWVCLGLVAAWGQQVEIYTAHRRAEPAKTVVPPMDTQIQTQASMSDMIQAFPSLLDRTSAEYVYGRLVARKTLPIQVTLVNKSTEKDLLVHSISIVKKDVAGFELAAMDKRILQGLGERGQSRDPRNIALRIITGIGTALVPFPTFLNVGNSFVPAVAAWNGPGVSAFEKIFPDYTVAQVIRLSNQAFNANQVVTKNQSLNVTVFVPREFIEVDGKMTSQAARNQYETFVSKYRVSVSASFIEPVDDSDLMVLGAKWTKDEGKLTLKGRGFTKTDLVEVTEDGKTAVIFGEDAGQLELEDSKSLAVKLGEKYQGKYVTIRVLRSGRTGKSNTYGILIK